MPELCIFFCYPFIDVRIIPTVPILAVGLQGCINNPRVVLTRNYAGRYAFCKWVIVKSSVMPEFTLHIFLYTFSDVRIKPSRNITTHWANSGSGTSRQH
jgi:hypothetical protein